MRKLLKSLLAATTVLAVAPAIATAQPPDCASTCFESECGDTCWNGRVTTCGAYGVCSSSRAEPSDVTTSVAQDKEQQSAAASLVCSESQQAAEPSVAVES